MTKTELKAKLEAGAFLADLFDFTDGQECLIYKADRFETTDNIIYIPELHGEDIDSAIDECYTGKDFVEECNGHIDLAEELFWFVDWQHPNIRDILETYDEDEFAEKYGFSMDEF